MALPNKQIKTILYPSENTIQRWITKDYEDGCGVVVGEDIPCDAVVRERHGGCSRAVVDFVDTGCTDSQSLGSNLSCSGRCGIIS